MRLQDGHEKAAKMIELVVPFNTLCRMYDDLGDFDFGHPLFTHIAKLGNNGLIFDNGYILE